jgi:AcrR family transcriptional regulator
LFHSCKITIKGNIYLLEFKMTFSYIEHLEKDFQENPPKRKGERTRDKIKIAVAKCLEKRGYIAMRVIDVAEEAGIAEGSFYVYFKDKTEATLAVLTGLWENFFLLGEPRAIVRTPFDTIRMANRRWIAVCRANSGLMRCILQFGDEALEFSQLSQRANSIWYERVATGARLRQGQKRYAPLLAARLLGGMMDDLVRRLVIYPDEDLLNLLNEVGLDDDGIADSSSLIWFRIFHPDEPPPAEMPAPVVELANWLWPNILSSDLKES